MNSELKKYKCKFCEWSTNNSKSIGGHTKFCQYNPEKDKNKLSNKGAGYNFRASSSITKSKMRKSSKLRWSKQEEKDKISRSVKELWKNPEYRLAHFNSGEQYRHCDPNIYSPEERRLEEVLNKHNIFTAHNKYIEGYFPDFLILDSNILVEMDTYWHTIDGAKERDEIRQAR